MARKEQTQQERSVPNGQEDVIRGFEGLTAARLTNEVIQARRRTNDATQGIRTPADRFVQLTVLGVASKYVSNRKR
jgi:hypothetical protein